MFRGSDVRERHCREGVVGERVVIRKMKRDCQVNGCWINVEDRIVVWGRDCGCWVSVGDGIVVGKRIVG